MEVYTEQQSEILSQTLSDAIEELFGIKLEDCYDYYLFDDRQDAWIQISEDSSAIGIEQRDFQHDSIFRMYFDDSNGHTDYLSFVRNIYAVSDITTDDISAVLDKADDFGIKLI